MDIESRVRTGVLIPHVEFPFSAGEHGFIVHLKK